MGIPEPITVCLAIGAALDGEGVEWVIGGSLCSSVHGIPRSTQDVDVVAALRPRHVAGLLAALGEAWYADEDAIRAALRHGTSFNLVHLDTMTKVDVFLPVDDLAALELDRRMRVVVAEDGASLPFASPEDIILQKLRWYDRGGRVSDRQWRDVLGVLMIQRGRLDDTYLTHHARVLGLRDLLTLAMQRSSP